MSKALLVLALLIPLLFFGLVSVLDADPTVSELEQRTLKTAPVFSLDAVFSGTYFRELSEYYTDTFPFRDQFISVNRALGSIYKFGGNSAILDVSGGEGDGNSVVGTLPSDEMPSAAPSLLIPDFTQPPDDNTAPPTGTDTTPPPTATPTPDPTPPVVDLPNAGDGVKAGSIVVFGTRAMETVSYSEGGINKYASVINALAAKMPDARVIVLDAPNSAEFYSAAEMHTGKTSQKAIIDQAYSQLAAGIIGVDAYNRLALHQEEYIYFRTDHHWTALGAYYAYEAYCAATGLTPVPLSRFETGEIDGFVGSYYNFTAKYAISKVLKDNPDTLTYYLPVVNANMTLQDIDKNGNRITFAWPVVNTKVGKVSNKYIAFVGGDNEVGHIKTDAGTGKSAIVIKESYGNALVPFLTSHYDEIYLIDPRRLNKEGRPDFNLPSFVRSKGIDDVLFVNYTFSVSGAAFTPFMEKLK